MSFIDKNYSVKRTILKIIILGTEQALNGFELYEIQGEFLGKCLWTAWNLCWAGWAWQCWACGVPKQLNLKAN